MYEAKIMGYDLQNINQKQKQVEKVIREWAERCADMEIKTNVALTPEQINLLKRMHVMAINFALTQPESQRDPRKISYMANDELKTGLAAILLTHVLTNSLSKAKYTREYLFKNIVVWADDDGSAKHVNFSGIENFIVQDAIFPEIIYDWAIYRSPDGRGINALSDEKTHFQGLSNFKRGMSPISEFSRFERKFFESRQKKIIDQKESAEQAFRNSFVQQVAIAAAKQMLEHNDPMQIAQQLFAGKDYTLAIENLLSNQTIKSALEHFDGKNNLQLEDFSKSAEKMSFSVTNHRSNDEMSLDEILRDIKTLEKNHER